MLIYILSEVPPETLTLPQGITVKFLNDIDQYELNHTDQLSKNRFGIPLSKMEIKVYCLHYSAWKDFLMENEEICLVLESYMSLIENSQLILPSHYNLGTNEIVLPFDPEDNYNDNSDPTYTFGTPMGSDAYYINKGAAQKLVEEEIIFLPVDEMFLYMNFKECLALNVINESSWNRLSNEETLLDRNTNKLKTILSIDFWAEKAKRDAIQIIKYLFGMAEKLNLPLFLSDGTLLGYIRHGQIMGWDDDIDLSLDIDYLESLIKEIEKDGIYQITEHLWANNTVTYYKVWQKEGSKIDGYSYTFPFVDIWIYTDNKKDIDFQYFDPIPRDIIFPLKSSIFSQVRIAIPNQPLFYLDKMYKNWRTSIEVFQWNHQTETNSNFPLKANIETDVRGQIILKDIN